eukprot:3020517-Rhodomonas_salina.5
MVTVTTNPNKGAFPSHAVPVAPSPSLSCHLALPRPHALTHNSLAEQSDRAEDRRRVASRNHGDACFRAAVRVWRERVLTELWFAGGVDVRPASLT